MPPRTLSRQYVAITASHGMHTKATTRCDNMGTVTAGPAASSAGPAYRQVGRVVSHLICESGTFYE